MQTSDYKVKNRLILGLFVVLVIMLTTQNIFAQTQTIGSGNWNDGGTWDSGVPSSSDAVTINGGDTVFVDGTANSALSITINSTGVLQFIGNSGTNVSITVTNDVTITSTGKVTSLSDGSNGPTHTLNIGGDLTGTGSFDGYDVESFQIGTVVNVVFNGSGAQDFDLTGSPIQIHALTVSNNSSNDVTIDPSSLTLFSDFTINNDADVVLGSVTIVSDGGDFIINTSTGGGGSFDDGTSTLEFVGSSDAIISIVESREFNNITLNKSIGLFTLDGDGTGTDNFTINGTLALDNGTVTLSDANIVYGSSASLEYNDNSQQSVGPEWTTSLAPDNVTVNNIGGVLMGTTDLDNLTGDLILTSGDLDYTGTNNTLSVAGNVVGGSGSFGGSDDTLIVTGASSQVTSSNSTTISNLRLTVGGIQLSNITVEGELVVNTSGTVTATGSLTLASGCDLNIAGGTFNLSGQTLTKLGSNDLTVADGAALNTGGTSITGFIITNLASNSTINFSGTSSEDIPSDLYGNITVSNTHASGARVNGALTHQATSVLTVASGGILFTDGYDITNFTGYTLNGTVHFSGSSQETLPIAAFANLVVNNVGGVQLSGAASVSGTLTLTNGLVTTGANTLTIGSGGSISGASPSKYIIGNLANTFTTSSATKSYPLGESNTYRLVELTGSTTSGTAVTTGSIVTGNAGPLASLSGDLTRVSAIRYFQFINSTSACTVTVVNNFRVNSDDLVGSLNPNTSLRIATTVGTGGTWNERLLFGTINTNSLPVNITTTGSWSENIGVTATLYVALATTSIADNSLPVTLTTFTANAEFSKVTLNWQTESEIDNQGFNIYRATGANPDNWETLNQELIPGAGNTAAKTEYAFVDQSVQSGETYYYQLESISYNGVRELFVESTVTVVAPVPTEFALLNNYPNPFNPITNIKFQVPDQSEVTIIVYDVQGNLVKKLLSKSIYSAGEHVTQWDATDQLGTKVSSGIYFYQFVSGNYQKFGKMMLIK